MTTSSHDFIVAISKIKNLEEYRIACEAMKIRHKMLQKHAIAQFNLGTKVSFTDKRGNVVSGTVLKRNPKTIHVLADVTGTTWRVSPGLLRAA